MANNIQNQTKLRLLHSGRNGGFFRLSRRLAKRKLLILCYHGFQIVDEAGFRPLLFMRSELFAERLEAIHRHGFPVLRLDEGLRRLRDGTLPENAICLTIDDGFYSVLSIAAPLLKRYQFPSTLYVTSYYVGKRAPVFRLVVQYMFWKTRRERVDLSDQAWGLPQPIELTDSTTREASAWRIIEFGERQCDEPGRQRISGRLGERLDVPYADIVSSRMMNLVTPEEIRKLSSYGVDVQLHTHRHVELPTISEERAAQEIRENRAFLEALLEREIDHFCYPSGQWDRHQYKRLAEAGIRSATTCEPGLNDRSTPPLSLYRMLDGDSLPQIVFEAELFGFSELIRQLSGKRRRCDRARVAL